MVKDDQVRFIRFQKSAENKQREEISGDSEKDKMGNELPELRSIRFPRHPGVSVAVCEYFSEAAEVCLVRHHNPPKTVFSIDCCGAKAERELLWKAPDETAQRAHNNRDDATRDAAYIVSLSIMDKELGMVAISRTDTRTGADYYIGMPGSLDLEEAYRLEISGVDQGDGSAIKKRLREKEVQARRGDSSLPAYACVVGFREASALMSLVEDD